MDNPQERPAAVLDVKFVAGLITGEGWFGLQTSRKPTLKTKNGFIIRPCFALQMNDIETMERLAATFKLWNVGHHLHLYERSKMTSTWSDSLRIDIAGFKRVGSLIEIVLPHLSGTKKRAAEIVYEYIELRRSKPQASPYGDDEIKLVNALRAVNGANRGHKILLESSEAIRRVSRVA